MNNEQKAILKSQLPSGFQIISAMEHEGLAKIRGQYDKWAILIEWQFEDEPDTIWLETIDIAMRGRSGTVPIKDLKMNLLSLS